MNQHKNISKNRVKHTRSKFTITEDESLRRLVDKFGEGSWDDISANMPGRNQRQCHDRWIYYLSPRVNTDPWTPEEDALLIQRQQEIGSHWVRIAATFPGRTDTSIKNRWNIIKRRAYIDVKQRALLGRVEIQASAMEKSMQGSIPLEISPSKLTSESRSANSFGIDEDFANAILFNNFDFIMDDFSY